MVDFYDTVFIDINIRNCFAVEVLIIYKFFLRNPNNRQTISPESKVPIKTAGSQISLSIKLWVINFTDIIRRLAISLVETAGTGGSMLKSHTVFMPVKTVLVK